MDSRWDVSLAGPTRFPLFLTAVLWPLVAFWTLPQTLAGLGIGLYRRWQGHPGHLYRFGPFLFLVFRTPGPASAGISLGLVVFSQSPQILQHEFCHLITGLWLSWLYLPVYGLEYLLQGHDRSFHERITCRLERTVRWGWQVVERG